MPKHQFTINESIIPLAEVGSIGHTHTQVQALLDRKRDGRPLATAIRLTETALKIWDVRVDGRGKVLSFIDEEFCAEAAPRGFVMYQDGLYRGYVRKSTGEGLRDLHNNGECPNDCPYCRGENKQAEQEADRAGMKAQATSQHWKSGR